MEHASIPIIAYPLVSVQIGVHPCSSSNRRPKRFGYSLPYRPGSGLSAEKSGFSSSVRIVPGSTPAASRSVFEDNLIAVGINMKCDTIARVKRRDLEKHLRTHGCVFVHHGGRHDIWQNPLSKTTTAVPRHGEIKLGTARSVCRELQVPPPAKR